METPGYPHQVAHGEPERWLDTQSSTWYPAPENAIRGKPGSLSPQWVRVHVVAEPADVGFARRVLPTGIDVHEPAHRRGLVQILSGGRVRKTEPSMLEKVDMQHPLDSDPPSSRALRIRIARPEGIGGLFPGNDLFHVVQESFLAGLLPVFVETGTGKSNLAHGENRC